MMETKGVEKWRQTAKRKVMNDKTLQKFNNQWLRKKLIYKRLVVLKNYV